MIRSFKPQITFALAALTFAAPAAFAAPTSAMHAKKMAAVKTVYVCKICHVYYTPAMAKKLNYKDDMGHTLVKSAKAPIGYLDASKVKM